MSRNLKSDLDNLSTNNSITLGDNISIDGNFGQNNIDQNNGKYEKLVQDYVKLRSKLTILKKAYKELSESSAQKDQSIRKYEQEIEGLNFRNQQLTARVEILQQELEPNKRTNSISNMQNISANSSSNNNLVLASSNSSTSILSTNLPSSSYLQSKNNLPSIEILAEELEHKINENQSLHRRLNELEIDLRQKLVKNEQSLKQVEYEKLILEKKLETLQSTSKSNIEKLENDKIKLELNVIQLENQLRKTHHEKEMKESELLKAMSEHNLLIQEHNEIKKKPSYSSLDQESLNVTIKKENNKVNNQDLFLNNLKSFLNLLNKMYSCLQERLNNVNSKNSKLAHKCEQLLQEIENKFKNSNLNDLESVLNELFNSNHNLLQLIINKLMTNTIEINNQEMEQLKKKLKIYLNKLDQFLLNKETTIDNFSYFIKNILLSFNSSSEFSNSQIVNNKLITYLQSLIDILDKILFVLNEKLSLQYTLEYPTSITTIDECLVSYLTQIKQSLMQFSNFSESINIAEIIDEFKIRSVNSLNIKENTLAKDKEIENLKKIINEKDSELKEISEKLVFLKSEWEKDSNELNQLRLKLENLNSALLSMEESDKSNKQEILNLKNSITEAKKIEENKTEIKTEIEIKSESLIEKCEDLDKVIENITLSAYNKQIETLNKRIQYLDSKALFYYDEMKCMLERLQLQLDINNLQGNELNEIKDQLERTRNSYELQMSTMSDHLIEMTDRMTKQAEENEKLKHELNFCLENSTTTQSSQSKNSKNKKTK